MADTTTAPPQGFSSQFGLNRPVTITSSAKTNGANVEVTPNQGASVPDQQSFGYKSESLATWQAQRGIDTSQQIKLVKLAHMRYQHPDLPTITRFLRDFGMNITQQSPDGDRIWFRGYGVDPYVYYAQRGEKKFLGGTFLVESMDDLRKAAQLPGASEITEISDAPGGGHMITVTDPEGVPVNLLFGQTLVEPTPPPQDDNLVYNTETDKPRVRRFHRFTPGPAAVHKLGHFGLCTNKFEEQIRWYTSTFNLAPTDFLYVPDGENQTKEVAMFAHIDRGTDPTDHHSFFIATGPKPHVHHASFEVHDFDTQNLGHQWLAKQGYTSVWGVGRHILGSQIFDYWWDTTGNMIEHYADGDLVNKDTRVGWTGAGDESLAVWGPEVPKWFLD